MANYMAEVAGLLGVELGESFRIAYEEGISPFYYRLTKEKGIEQSEDNANWEVSAAVVLRDLMIGDTRAIKMPQIDKIFDVDRLKKIVALIEKANALSE